MWAEGSFKKVIISSESWNWVVWEKMSAAILELIRSVKTKEVKLTPQEANVIATCESKAIRDYATGFLVGFCTFPAILKFTWKTGLFSTFCISGGAGSLVGDWAVRRSLDPWVDQILDMDGSQMQTALANIILNKHRNNPWMMQRLYKRFYSEKVYDDTNSDKPLLRWRFRNHFGDIVDHSQGTHGDDSQGYAHVNSHSAFDGNKARIKINKVSMNTTSADVMEDPLDSIFGGSAPEEEILHPVVSSTPTARARNHSQRRSHRRRRRMHLESLAEKHEQLQDIMDGTVPGQHTIRKPIVGLCYQNCFGDNLDHSDDQWKHENDSLVISLDDSDDKKRTFEAMKFQWTLVLK
ncbi:hypothetical protein M5689_005802 [Euphorbia peplus]|nr:hypothetical protein M5689_005802 [Euphorbia peplus]